jgi:hypothetical protein
MHRNTQTTNDKYAPVVVWPEKKEKKKKPQLENEVKLIVLVERALHSF